VLLFYGEALVDPAQTRVGWTPILTIRYLIIQYIHSYVPYLEAISSMRFVRAHHGVLTRNIFTYYLQHLTVRTITPVLQSLNTTSLSLFSMSYKYTVLV